MKFNAYRFTQDTTGALMAIENISSSSIPSRDELETAHLRTAKLLQEQETASPDELLAAAFQELHTALEELRVVDEELRSQNEKLVSARHAIQVERQRYYNLFDFAPDGFLVTDLNGGVQEANQAVGRMLNIAPKQLVGKPIFVFIKQPGRKVIRQKLIGFADNLEPITAEAVFQPRMAPALPVSLKIGLVFNSEGNLPYLLWQLRDATEWTNILAALRLSEEENRKKNNELSKFNHRLLQGQEAERRRLARELHDEIGQSLTGLKIMMAMALESHDETTLESSLQEIDQLIEQVRNLALELRPAMLDDFGLIPALLWQFKRFTSQTGVKVNFSHKEYTVRVPAEVETAAYRIIQESLTNTARHAGVSEVNVHLYTCNLKLYIEIRDFGYGFDYQAVLTDRLSTGLNGMMERAKLVGGQLTIQSSAGQGTYIQVTLPIGIEDNDG